MNASSVMQENTLTLLQLNAINVLQVSLELILHLKTALSVSMGPLQMGGTVLLAHPVKLVTHQ